MVSLIWCYGRQDRREVGYPSLELPAPERVTELTRKELTRCLAFRGDIQSILSTLVSFLRGCGVLVSALPEDGTTSDQSELVYVNILSMR